MRTNTRGGRDQDRWRGEQGEWSRRRKADRDHRQLIIFYLRHRNLKESANRVDDWYRRIRPFKVQASYEVSTVLSESCFAKSMSGTLILGDNPDCERRNPRNCEGDRGVVRLVQAMDEVS